MDFIYQMLASLPYPRTSYAGKTIVVTGSNTGLGKEAARHYARLGADRLILAVRSVDKGNDAKADIESTTKCGKNVIQVRQLDMSSYASVKSFASKLESEVDRLDIANLNAGLAKKDYGTAEDNEESITVNVVSTFLLSALLMPKLKATAKKYDTRPVLAITSSGAHKMSKFPQKDAPQGKLFETINDVDPSTYQGGQQYPLSKMLEIFAVRSIGEKSPNSPVTVNCLDPGFCHSELSRDFPGWTFYLMKLFLARSTEKGSRTLVHAGTAGKETHGKYLSNCALGEPSEIVVGEGGKQLQDRLWVELEGKLEKISPGCTKNFKD